MTSTNQDHAITCVLKAIDVIRNGGMVIMVDDEDRENEGDLVFAAEHVTGEKINFMIREARGLVCLSLAAEVIDRLKLPMMEDSTKRCGAKSTAFTVSIEARHGVSTGISAADRAHTIKVAVDEKTTPDDIVVPGHIFPLKARSGGVLERAGHTEGSVDLARMAGLKGAAVICEIMNEDGTMARMADLKSFAERHDIPIVTIADLITFKLLKDSLIEEVSHGVLETAHGSFRTVMFKSLIDGMNHIALIKGDDFENKVVDVRVHRQRPILDVMTRLSGGEHDLIDYGIRMLSASDAGVLLYLTRSEVETSVASEFAILVGAHVPPHSRSWLETDPRMLGVGAQILRHLGVRKMRVHMSSPQPLKGLSGFELEVTGIEQIRS